MRGGGAIAESTQTQTEDAVADNSNFNMKDKKKKRRSRKKQNSIIPVSSSLNEIRDGEVKVLVGVSRSNNVASNKDQLPRASDVAFNSLPIMHLDEQKSYSGKGALQNHNSFGAHVNGRVFSNSCPEPVCCNATLDSNDGNVFQSHLNNGKAQRKYFAPHWPEDAIRKALEKGDVFRALFRVNSHNKVEAYCKIEGVQTDVLISGLVSQNRAVEGDIVAITVDPPPLWTKMKGFTEVVENSHANTDCSLHPEGGDFVIDSVKWKNTLDIYCSHSNGDNCLTPQNELGYENDYCSREIANPELIGPSVKCRLNGTSSLISDDSGAGGSSCGVEGLSLHVMENLHAVVSSLPSKRPTGRVVGIIERSPRRNTVVGFLGVKQWIRVREGSRKDSKKNTLPLSTFNQRCIMLTPTDPKFPKMMVPLRNLPECIMNRLEASDATVEMDLVAAQIVDWEEESNFPEAHVIHSFGRGGELEAQIAAVLFENAINVSEFSTETLSCLPCGPWEVPNEEILSRRDLRNLCVFTIDPSTATDLDDALSIEALSNGIFRVGVHIADVSYFVLPDTALDIDAQIRSTSVYMLLRKLPMLPPLLSENLASLNPGADKLAFSMFWDINPDGEVLDRWICRTVIRSCCKLSYEHAQDIINGVCDAQISNVVLNNWPELHGCFEWSDVFRAVKSLHGLSRILKERRFNDGALSLESPKVGFLLDEEGIPYDSILCRRSESNFLVEEFMLLANRTAAELITRVYPTSALLRRHPEPNLRKLRELEAFCKKNGLQLDISSSAQLHHSLERIRGELENDPVLFDLLMSYASRPMQLAAYFCSGESKDSESDWAHYALAVPLYTHFTSPLRRYPDIVVHRTLAATVEAEEMYIKHIGSLEKLNAEKSLRCFTGMHHVKEIIESIEAQQTLSAAAIKYRIPCAEMISVVAAHCNNRKLATRHVRDATDRLYMWALLRKKEVLCVEARVLGLGPRFMSIYIHKLAVERRIYYDEIEGLAVEWLEETSTLLLSRYLNKHYNRRVSLGKCKRLEDMALIVCPCDSGLSLNLSGYNGGGINRGHCQSEGDVDVIFSGVPRMVDVEPAVFPLTVRLFSTIPVALHAVGGDDGPIDIGAKLYISSYFR